MYSAAWYAALEWLQRRTTMVAITDPLITAEHETDEDQGEVSMPTPPAHTAAD